MERSANYAWVGFISTALLVMLVAFIVWLAGANLRGVYDYYDIRFEGPVRGISQGTEVHFNGIKVGELLKLTIDQKDTRYVIARARITSDIPVKEDSYAVLEPLGITGVNYVQISAGSTGKRLMTASTPTGDVPVIPSRHDALSDILSGGGTIVLRAADSLNRLNQILSDSNIKTFSQTLNDVRDVTRELNARKSLFADAQKTLQGADAAVQQIASLAKSSEGLVNGEAKHSLAKLGDAAAEIQETSRALHVTLSKLQGPSGDFAAQGLPKLTDEIDSLQRATDRLDRLIGDIQTNPRAAFLKAPAKEIEVKP